MKRRSGLGSLIPGEDLAAAQTSLAEMVQIEQITVNPFQPRRTFAPEALEELADSIRQYGIIQPLTVRRQQVGFQLIAGERRLQAAQKAGLTAVPVVIRECGDDEMLALALVENLQREDLNAMEAATSYQQLIELFGLSQSEVAEKVGKSRSTVANTLRLLALPDTIQHAVVNGALSEGQARTLLVIESPQRQQAIFQQTVKKGLSVRALEKLVQAEGKVRKDKPSHSRDVTDANLLALQDELQLTLSSRVQFKANSTANSGTLEIDYYSAADLQAIYEALIGRKN